MFLAKNIQLHTDSRQFFDMKLRRLPVALRLVPGLVRTRNLGRACGGQEGGRGENNYNSHDASLPTKHAANKNKDRPFHKTLRNYYENVRPKQLHNVHCASLPMDIRILSPHQHTNHHENHRIYDYDSLTVFKYWLRG